MKRLQGGASEAQQQKMVTPATTNSAAYQLYLKGRYFWSLRGDNIPRSIEYFQQAVAADPNFALAYAGLADAYAVAPGYGSITPRQAMRDGEMAAHKAIALDPSSSEAHAAMANVVSNIKPGEGAPEYLRALQLNPNNAAARYLYAFTCLMPQKRFDEALQEFRTALALDPLSPIMNVNYAATLMAAHRYPESLAQFQRAAEIAPSFGPVYLKSTLLYAAWDKVDEGFRAWKQFDPKAVNNGTSRKALGEMMAASILARRQASGYWPASYIASGYAVAGDRERTFEWLNAAVAEQDFQLGEFIRYPVFDDIRSDPRYTAMMQRLGLPQ
ncbi:MAG TPA: tetratricopeptide repeat protein [Terriglobales bacterium]|nr:tetratricopeptide repeat protein [Terriglobales bacterium]